MGIILVCKLSSGREASDTVRSQEARHQARDASTIRAHGSRDRTASPRLLCSAHSVHFKYTCSSHPPSMIQGTGARMMGGGGACAVLLPHTGLRDMFARLGSSWKSHTGLRDMFARLGSSWNFLHTGSREMFARLGSSWNLTRAYVRHMYSQALLLPHTCVLARVPSCWLTRAYMKCFAATTTMINCVHSPSTPESTSNPHPAHHRFIGHRWLI